MHQGSDHRPTSLSVGARIRYLRRRRGGMTQQILADRAGLSQGFISQVESGSKSIERRSTLAAIAEVLQVSVGELTGSADPTDPAKEKAALAVPAIREALVLREAGEREDDTDPTTDDAVRAAMLAEARCDYATAMSALPGLLSRCTGADLVNLARITMFLLRGHGYPDLARDAARLGVAEARRLEDPALVGVAEFTRANSLPVETSALGARVAGSAADELQPHTADPRTRQAYGMLHLTAALREATAQEGSAVRARLQEATTEAAMLGEPDGLGISMLVFGPTNVGVWQMTVATELGDPDEVLRTADTLAPERLPVPQRRATFHALRGRAFVAVGGRDEEAALALLKAEEIAPQWARLQSSVRDAARAIVKRAGRRAPVSRSQRRLADVFELRV
jgi:transcriptional regulator with XRE-family HTH domain